MARDKIHGFFDSAIKGIDNQFYGGKLEALREKNLVVEPTESKDESSKKSKLSRRKFLRDMVAGGVGLATGAALGGAAGLIVRGRREEQLKSREVLRTEPYNVVILGDSNSNPDEKSLGDTSWPDKLEMYANKEKLQPDFENPLKQSFPVEIETIAIGGATAGVDRESGSSAFINQDVAKRMDRFKDKLGNRNQKSDLAVIMLGTNNIWNSETQQDNSKLPNPESFKLDYEKMLEEIVERLSPKRILILAIPPMFPMEGNSVTNRMREKVDELNDVLNSVAMGMGLDLGTAGIKVDFKDPYVGIGRRLVRSVDINDDGVHLLEPASEEVAKTVATYIAESVRNQS